MPEHEPLARTGPSRRKLSVLGLMAFVIAILTALPASASEAELVLPDLGSVTFLGGINGHNLLLGGLVVCVLGMLFGLWMYTQLKNMPVHRSMRDISELIF